MPHNSSSPFLPCSAVVQVTEALNPKRNSSRLPPLPPTPGLGLMCMLNWAFFHGHVATGEFQSQGNFFNLLVK